MFLDGLQELPHARECRGLERSPVVLREKEDTADLGLLKRHIQRRCVGIGVHREHQQLADLLSHTHLLDITVNPLVKRGGGLSAWSGGYSRFRRAGPTGAQRQQKDHQPQERLLAQKAAISSATC